MRDRRDHRLDAAGKLASVISAAIGLATLAITTPDSAAPEPPAR